MQRVLKPAGRRAGVPWVGFHTFRHTCATMLFRSGANAVAVQKHMGHHSPAFTLSTYVHFLDDDLPRILPGASGVSPLQSQSQRQQPDATSPCLMR
jgi:integrase